MSETHRDETERDTAIVCPKCGEGVTQVEPEKQDEPAVDFIVAGGGEIVSAKTVALLEYTFNPCGHTALGTQDQDNGRSLRTGADQEAEQ